MDLNQYLCIGRMVRDVEQSFTSKGTCVANGCIAINTGFGERKTTLFMEFMAFSKTAEIISKYCKKGNEVMFAGTLVCEEWVDKNTGGKRSRIKLNVDKVSLGAEKRGSSYEEGEHGAKMDENEHNVNPNPMPPFEKPSAPNKVDADMPF